MKNELSNSNIVGLLQEFYDQVKSISKKEDIDKAKIYSSQLINRYKVWMLHSLVEANDGKDVPKIIK